jgi:hypothetical protein
MDAIKQNLDQAMDCDFQKSGVPASAAKEPGTHGLDQIEG